MKMTRPRIVVLVALVILAGVVNKCARDARKDACVKQHWQVERLAVMSARACGDDHYDKDTCDMSVQAQMSARDTADYLCD